MNGISKWIIVIILIGGILIGTGKTIQTVLTNSKAIDDLKKVKTETRIVKLETNYKNIEKDLEKIDKKIDGLCNMFNDILE